MSTDTASIGGERSDTFEVAVESALGGVRGAFRQLVGAIADDDIRPHELEKMLGLHKTLAWKVVKIIESEDVLTSYLRIPGTGAVNKVLDAAQRCGAGADSAAAVRDALEALDEVIERHAGDRESFEIMLAGMSPADPGDVAVAFRRAGFRSTSFVWGVQARTVMRAVIAHPSATEGHVDAAAIFGCVGLRRLRADRDWVVNRWRPTDDAGEPIRVVREPLGAVNGDGPPLMEKWCSSPLPTFRREVLPDSTTADELVAGRTGNTGAVTFFTGEVIRAVMPRYTAPDNYIMAQNLELRTPCDAVVFDHIVHRDLFGPVQPRLHVFGEIAGRPLYDTLRSNRDRLETHERVERLGSVADMACDDVPRYDEMVGATCEQLGWDAAVFDVYRVRIEFPYVPATISLDYPLPDRP